MSSWSLVLQYNRCRAHNNAATQWAHAGCWKCCQLPSLFERCSTRTTPLGTTHSSRTVRCTALRAQTLVRPCELFSDIAASVSRTPLLAHMARATLLGRRGEGGRGAASSDVVHGSIPRVRHSERLSIHCATTITVEGQDVRRLWCSAAKWKMSWMYLSYCTRSMCPPMVQ